MDAGAILDLEGAERLSVLSPLPANTVRHPILVRLFQRGDSIFVPTAQNPMNTALQPGLLLLDLSVPIVRPHDFDSALRALPQSRKSPLRRVLDRDGRSLGPRPRPSGVRPADCAAFLPVWLYCEWLRSNACARRVTRLSFPDDRSSFPGGRGNA